MISNAPEKITKYLNSVAHLAPNTRDLYKNALQKLMGFCDCSHIKTDIIPAYVEFLKASGCNGKTIQQYLTIAKMFFRYNGIEINYSYRIPADERKAAKLKALNRWFTEEDVEKCKNYTFSGLINSTNPARNQLIVHLLIDTGARVREISCIKRKDVNLKARTVFLSDSKTEPRPAFFSKNTARLLSKYFKTLMVSDNYRLFPSTTQVQKIINDMLVDLGLKHGADARGPHTFRHYVATWLHYEGGMSIVDIAFLLGDTPDTITKNYIHPTSKMLQRRVNETMKW